MFKRKKTSFPRNKQFVIDIASEVLGEQKSKNKKSWWSPFIAIFYTFLSCLAFLITSVFVKKLIYISPGQLSMVRNLGVLAGNLPIAIYSTKSIFGPKRYFWLLLLRSFLAATALYLTLLCYRYLPLAEASIIMASVPALVTLIAHFYLKEPCGVVHVLSTLVTAVGVLISIRLPELLQNRSRTDFNQDYIIGLASGFSCIVIVAITFVSLRKLQNVHFSVIQLYFGFLGTIENGVLTGLFEKYNWPRCGGWDNIQVILIGVFGFIGHVFITLAFQKEVASIVSTTKSAFDIIISSIFQFLFFHSVPDFYTLIGGFLVILAVSSIGFYKWLIDQPEDSVYRKRLQRLLA